MYSEITVYNVFFLKNWNFFIYTISYWVKILLQEKWNSIVTDVKSLYMDMNKSWKKNYPNYLKGWKDSSFELSTKKCVLEQYSKSF